jgi:cation diffusion facilitator family transporter
MEASGISSELRNRKSALAVNLGLAANIFLAITKTAVGIFGHSPALLADGINSTSDVAYTAVVAVFMRLARKPADDTHPYGHSQMEAIASLVVGSFVITTAIAIFWTAINNVFELVIGEVTAQGAALITLWIALLTVAIKLVLTFYTRRIGEQTSNPAVIAIAYDHRNDVFSAGGAAIGIFLGRQGLPWVDPLVGAFVALLVLRTGVEIMRQSSAELMDAVPSKALAVRINAMLESVDGVETVEEVHAHRFGPYLVINLTIGVDGDLSVTEGDRIASQVEQQVTEQIDLVRKVYVHYHPVSIPDMPDVSSQLPVLHCRLE